MIFNHKGCAVLFILKRSQAITDLIDPLDIMNAAFVVGCKIHHKQRIHHSKLSYAGSDCRFMQGTFPGLCVQPKVCKGTNLAVLEGSNCHSRDSHLLCCFQYSFYKPIVS